MNRRLLLASIATLPAGQAFAQKMSPTAPAPSAMTDAQQKHIRDTTAYGSLSLLLSRMAKSKVAHPLLKQFVDFEIAEQETVGGILKAIQTNAAPSGATPSPSDADLMQNLDDAGKASVEKLRALKAGSEFDAITSATKSKDTGNSWTSRKSILSPPIISTKPMSRSSRGA